jgi:sterol desaturase/sphingolipid hydroxylase (fatty acid hydroxylase superfamily)
MKQCAWCGKEYPDDASVCAIDGQPLAARKSPEATAAEQQESKPWPRQVIIPAVLWLVANILLAYFFGAPATVLFGWATALGAAIDCAQFKNNGRRVLGIGFKPVVVFAVCAFFLWGFGFIWYLILRHKVKTAPPPPPEPQDQVKIAE